MPHEDNSTEKHTDRKDGEHRTEQPENGRQSPPSATTDPGSESSTGSGENQKNMDPTKLQNHEDQPRKCRQSQPSGVEDKGSGPQSDSEGKQENLNHTKLQNKKTKDGEGKAGSSSQSLQEQPRKAAQSQSSHVEDQDSRSSPDSEGKQENTKSSNLEIKEAGMLHEKDSLQNHPYHKDGEGLNRQSSQEHQGKRRLGKDTDTSPDSGGNQENTNKLQKKEMFHGNDSSQTCPNQKAGESGTAFSRQSSREQPEKPTPSQASGVEETGLGSHSHSRPYQVNTYPVRRQKKGVGVGVSISVTSEWKHKVGGGT
ncbi:hypothetical protein NFI96_034319 [Prochilodus magdalenae]|nr:hypothetical protein NFI96_034319 [Prochilodus magdalenae]